MSLKPSTRQFISLYPKPWSLRGDGRLTYRDLFIKDYENLVMPIIGTSRSDVNLTASIEGADAELFRAILYENHGHRFQITDLHLVCKTVNRIAQGIFHYGSINFEVLKIHDKIVLQKFTSYHAKKFGPFYCQWVPRTERKNWFSYFKVIRGNHFWRISLPSSICHWFLYWVILQSLDLVETMFPKFQMDDFMKDLTKPTVFNTEKYDLLRACCAGHLTKKFGWNRGDRSDGLQSEFFLIHRELKKAICLAKLRNHIINEINILAVSLNLDAKVKFEGLPQTSEIEKYLNEFSCGDAPIADFFKFVRNY